MNKIISYILSFYICFFMATFFTGCFDLADTCETEVASRMFSPDKTIQAITEITDCGATTSPSYGVRIVESTDTTDDGDRDNTILGSNNRVGIKWISNDTLLITGADTTNGYIMKTQLKLKKKKTDINILYDK